MSTDKTVYRSTHPDVLSVWHASIEAREAWGELMETFLDEHGFGTRNVYVSHSGRVLGVEHIEGEDVPDGWRIDSRTGYLMPRLASRKGKAIGASLAELTQPDPRDAMPGMPKTMFVSLALLTCGLALIDGALYATWSRPIPEERVDLTIWERVKLSEYYAAVEAAEAAQAQKGGQP
ncbi:hypothetical protein [Nonomuraea pusilla]|uniref:Uncharacterized protein n=1 Tax=Nonomuraea pusilla TaxID=46177 RepID=A0A1H8K508_9ACTN|nr:hypothetical protein [Nonomuraea pusilla]SEN88043.1 hypothetical protein SAMN05660976_08526 [Nonomuraea pusilla]